MERWEGRSVYVFQAFAMFEAPVPVVHFSVSTPAAISCVGGGGHRTSSSSNCSTCADIGVHRTAVAVIAAPVPVEEYNATALAVTTAPAPGWSTMLHKIITVTALLFSN